MENVFFDCNFQKNQPAARQILATSLVKGEELKLKSKFWLTISVIVVLSNTLEAPTLPKNFLKNPPSLHNLPTPITSQWQ